VVLLRLDDHVAVGVDGSRHRDERVRMVMLTSTTIARGGVLGRGDIGRHRELVLRGLAPTLTSPPALTSQTANRRLGILDELHVDRRAEADELRLPARRLPRRRMHLVFRCIADALIRSVVGIYSGWLICRPVGDRGACGRRNTSTGTSRRCRCPAARRRRDGNLLPSERSCFLQAVAGSAARRGESTRPVVRAVSFA